MSIDLLAFSPHPDDAEIGCGGLLLLAARQGLRTAIVDLSEGEKSTRGTPSVRHSEKTAAAALLGLATRNSLGFPDTRIGTDPDHEADVVSCLRDLQPRLVLAPHFDDRHPDHEASARLIKRAVFFSGVAKVGSGTPHRVERLLHYCIHKPFAPSLVFDVTAVWPEYTELIATYRSQFSTPDEDDGAATPLSDGRFLHSLDVRGRHFGAMIHADYGEPYYSSAPLSFESPSALFRSGDSRTRYGSFS